MEEEKEEEVIKKEESKKENSKSIFSNQIPYSITSALGAPTAIFFLPSFSLLYAPIQTSFLPILFPALINLIMILRVLQK